jgi:uncharacterized membrane protein YczE
MQTKEKAKRHATFVISLFFSGLGIAFTKTGGIGVSPVSSLANVLSIKLPAITMGTWLIVTNLLMLLCQIAILRRKFKPYQFLQVPLAAVFGYFTDIGMMITSLIPVNCYGMQLAMSVIGAAVLGFGISLAVIANVMMSSGEALVKVFGDTLKKEFGTVKIAFDICYVAVSALISMLLFGGAIHGIREGTLIVALTTGMFVKMFTAIIKNPLTKFLSGK